MENAVLKIRIGHSDREEGRESMREWSEYGI